MTPQDRLLRLACKPPHLRDSEIACTSSVVLERMLNAPSDPGALLSIQATRDAVRRELLRRFPDYVDVTDVDNAVTRVFAHFPGNSWREAALRDVCAVALGKPA